MSREQPLPPCHRRGTNEGVGQPSTAEASPRHIHHSGPLSAAPSPPAVFDCKSCCNILEFKTYLYSLARVLDDLSFGLRIRVKRSQYSSFLNLAGGTASTRPTCHWPAPKPENCMAKESENPTAQENPCSPRAKNGHKLRGQLVLPSRRQRKLCNGAGRDWKSGTGGCIGYVLTLLANAYPWRPTPERSGPSDPFGRCGSLLPSRAAGALLQRAFSRARRWAYVRRPFPLSSFGRIPCRPPALHQVQRTLGRDSPGELRQKQGWRDRPVARLDQPDGHSSSRDNAGAPPKQGRSEYQPQRRRGRTGPQRASNFQSTTNPCGQRGRWPTHRQRWLCHPGGVWRRPDRWPTRLGEKYSTSPNRVPRQLPHSRGREGSTLPPTPGGARSAMRG